MARAFGLKAELDFRYILDIEASVGKNAPNHRDDVLLVQYLLAVWLAHEKDLPRLIPLLATTPILKIDGICGDKTKGVINTFEVFHQPNGVTNDGRIDPSFQTSRTSKMFLLNQIFFFAGGLRGDPFFREAQLRAHFPDELRKSLYR